MKCILIIALSFLRLQGIAQKDIEIQDAAKHGNDSVRICSKIYGGKYLENVKGSPTFLDVGGNYPNAPLTLVT